MMTCPPLSLGLSRPTAQPVRTRVRRRHTRRARTASARSHGTSKLRVFEAGDSALCEPLLFHAAQAPRRGPPTDAV